MPLKLVTSFLTETSTTRDPGISPEMRIAESNHRIANNLTVISGLVRLHAAEVAKASEPYSSDQVRGLLMEIGGRIETVSRLHRLLTETARGKAPELGSYLHDIANSVVSSLSTSGRADCLQVDVGTCSLPANQALSVGFIVGELVTNAVKYAHPAGVIGEIGLRCGPGPHGGTLVEVSDDGVGLPEGFDPTQQGGLGLRLVRSLAHQLGAELSFESEGLGLTARLLIPPNRPVELD